MINLRYSLGQSFYPYMKIVKIIDSAQNRAHHSGGYENTEKYYKKDKKKVLIRKL